jgi:alkylation response protein AidB-like acyl-CoA dehydrogenase
MQLLSDDQFREQARAYIALYWTSSHQPSAMRITTPQATSVLPQDAWFAALFDSGWALGSWPRDHGGLGWSMA